MITSASNPRLKLIRKLESRRQRDKLGLFVCEGEDLVDAARAAGIEPVDLLVAGEDVEPELLAGVSTMAHPPRVIGVYRRSDLPPFEQRPASLALWHVSDPGNVGTLIRTADAFGAAIGLSEGCADPTAPRALRASAGATFRVPLGALRRSGRAGAWRSSRAPAIRLRHRKAQSCSCSAPNGRGCRKTSSPPATPWRRSRSRSRPSP